MGTAPDGLPGEFTVTARVPRPDPLLDRSGVQLEAARALVRVGDGRDLRGEGQRAVGRPARVGDEHLVAGIEEHEEGGVEGAARSRRDDHLLGRAGEAVPGLDLAGDQLSNAVEPDAGQ